MTIKEPQKIHSFEAQDYKLLPEIISKIMSAFKFLFPGFDFIQLIKDLVLFSGIYNLRKHNRVVQELIDKENFVKIKFNNSNIIHYAIKHMVIVGSFSTIFYFPICTLLNKNNKIAYLDNLDEVEEIYTDTIDDVNCIKCLSTIKKPRNRYLLSENFTGTFLKLLSN